MQTRPNLHSLPLGLSVPGARTGTLGFWIKFVQYHNQKYPPVASSIFALEMQPTPATDKTGFSHFTSSWQAYCSCIKSSIEKLNLYIALKTAPKVTMTHITVSWPIRKCYRILPQKLVVQAVLDSSRRERRAKIPTRWINYQWNRRWSTPSTSQHHEWNDTTPFFRIMV